MAGGTVRSARRSVEVPSAECCGFVRLTPMRWVVGILVGGLVLAHCGVAVAGGPVSPAPATAATPSSVAATPVVRLSPELRDRFTAGLALLKSGEAAKAGREFGDPAWGTTPIQEYASLFLAQSLLKTGDIAGARGAAVHAAADGASEGRPTPSMLLQAAAV